jgi:hypothetical protein
MSEIDDVEIRFRGNGAGPYVQAPLVHPSYKITCIWADGRKVTIEQAMFPHEIRAILEMEGWENPILCRSIDEVNFFIIPDEIKILGGTIFAYPSEDSL